jgi:deoxyhypusine synthase
VLGGADVLLGVEIRADRDRLVGGARVQRAGVVRRDDCDRAEPKLARGAHTAYVNCDATIALPILVTALSQTAAKYMKGRKRPNFTFAGRDLTIEVP